MLQKEDKMAIHTMRSLSLGRSPALYEGPTSLTFDRNIPCNTPHNPYTGRVFRRDCTSAGGSF